jgi:hypothetical protein
LAHGTTLSFPYAVNAAELFLAEERALEIKNLIQINRNNTHQTLFHTQDLLDIYRKNALQNQKFYSHEIY